MLSFLKSNKSIVNNKSGKSATSNYNSNSNFNKSAIADNDHNDSNIYLNTSDPGDHPMHHYNTRSKQKAAATSRQVAVEIFSTHL